MVILKYKLTLFYRFSDYKENKISKWRNFLILDLIRSKFILNKV